MFVTRAALGWLVVALVAAAGCTLLGFWQLGVALNRGSAQPNSTLSPIDAVLQPQQPFGVAAQGRRVTASGQVDVAKQFRVPQPGSQGQPGWWVVSALRTPNGWLPVVRGWTSAPQAPQLDVQTEFTGILQPDESTSPTTDLPPDAAASIDAARLANSWGTPIFNGYLLAEQPSPGLVQVEPAPQSRRVDLKNAAYALQWWAFGGFGLFWWWKIIRQPVRKQEELPS